MLRSSAQTSLIPFSSVSVFLQALSLHLQHCPVTLRHAPHVSPSLAAYLARHSQTNTAGQTRRDEQREDITSRVWLH
ncbi:hypothetical protein E2C01_000607 [Portunus trituberculatus]|uniref:Uncharacterized protein n=1 Tax=Portunus trituberculatus TaxID=210409 RepID=A0A5B7CHX6_PORTR|nr:hypothetical protein [Portunus trituberculatus]